MRANKANVGEVKQSYWIQERRNKDSSWFDSIGLDTKATLDEAKKEATDWRKFKGNRDIEVRLIVRTDVVIA